MFHYAVVFVMIALIAALLGMHRGYLRRRQVHRSPRERNHLSTLNLAILTAGTLVLSWQATPRSAWAFPSNAEMRSVGGAPVGIPVQEFFNKSVAALAREMLLQQHLDAQVFGAQPIRRAIEIDLFAPGDVGIVMRYCW